MRRVRMFSFTECVGFVQRLTELEKLRDAWNVLCSKCAYPLEMLFDLTQSVYLLEDPPTKYTLI